MKDRGRENKRLDERERERRPEGREGVGKEIRGLVRGNGRRRGSRRARRREEGRKQRKERRRGGGGGGGVERV